MAQFARYDVPGEVARVAQGTHHQDLAETPEAVASTTKVLAANAVHLARLLSDRPYPAS
ncbi:hypothetical protein ACIPYR_23870 [Streptomyces parvus]|uniref:hypothetical protein n=1 Tax=Streptomyces parvus TaxID=66428 RepID=UPI00382F54A2